MKRGRPRTRFPHPCETEGCDGQANIPGTAKGLCRHCYRGFSRRGRTQEERERDKREGAQNCTYCRERKPSEHFIRKSGKCRWCRTNAKRLKLFNVTLEEFQELEKEHGGRCAICFNSPTPNKGVLSVDHDHETGAIRGLLCDTCNRVLGMFRDDAERFFAAAAYLEEHRK